MRTFGNSFTYANKANEKEPRYVVSIGFDTASLYLTSHRDIHELPGVAVENVLRMRTAVSQRLRPIEGRSEIGAITFDAVDVAGALTDAIREKLQGGEGLRGKTVTLYMGYSGAAFTEYAVFQTQKIASCEYDRGVYTFKCSDITREQRKEIFDPKITTLTATLSAGETSTMSVASTAGFAPVVHSDSFSDAPNSEVYYVIIEKEWIRATGKTDTSFTGLTRGVMNTRAVEHTVDVTVAADQRTKVTEGIYLEFPVVKTILAVLTGEIHGTEDVLPDHWHLGIDPAWIKYDDFTNIGSDLWNTASDEQSFVARFTALKKIDGKKFLETELYQLIGCYPLVYSDGRLGIRRMNRILADAPAICTLDVDYVTSWSSLTFDMEGMYNDFRVDWNFDSEGKATRSTRLIDADSIGIHGRTGTKTLTFKGLYGSRHTDATVKGRLDSIRDRYSHPPALMNVSCVPSLNPIEVGDIVRVRLPLVRDFAANGDSIDRSFEVQRTRIDLRSGEVTLDLFGATGVGGNVATTGTGGQGPLGENVLPDGFYDSEGTDLATILDLEEVGDVMVASGGPYTLTGDADATDSGSIYYHLGDLEIPDGVVINIESNVQIRVRGFLQLDGDIVGVGNGQAGVEDNSAYGTTTPGLVGFGNSRGMDGILRVPEVNNGHWATNPAHMTIGRWSQVPYFELTTVVDPPALHGVPTDLRGTSGGPGGKVARSMDGSVYALGGSGANGGAGLILISRGLALGVSGSINLSGDDSASTSTVHAFQEDIYPGAGGAGAPGAMLILLDGPNLSLPDLSGNRFIARTGDNGAPLINTMLTPSGGQRSRAWPNKNGPIEGYLDPTMTSDQNLSNSAYRIQYIPAAQTAVEDQPSPVPAPSSLTVTGISNGFILEVGLPAFDMFDAVDVYMSSTNDRGDATLASQMKATYYTQPVSGAVTRYFWVRTRRGQTVSTWFPESETGGVSGTST